MKQFGETAIRAAELFTSKKVNTPGGAWEEAANEIIASRSGRGKGCPKNAFLALCSEGKVRGIPAGNYTRSEKNGRYALEALKILLNDPEYNNCLGLWKRVLHTLGEFEEKKHNGQMDVVTALWATGYIAG
jgi:hypothetical protein